LIVLNIGYDAGVINAKVFVIMVAMCLITTCMTTPAVSYIYPAHYQRAVALRTAAKEKQKRGDVERAGSPETTDGANNGFMLCIDKLNNLPGMMTILEMLNHAVPKSESESTNSTLAVPSPDGPLPPTTEKGEILGPKLLALRLLHLTDRSSSVLLAATERAEVLRRDSLMTVFQAFAKLNGIFVRPRMTLSTDPEDFAHSIYDEAVESGTGVIVIPWNSSALPDPPMKNSDASQNPILSRPLVTSNTQVVSRLLSTTANTGLVTAVFVDREFGGSGHFLNIVVPLYGSIDDEEVLKMASALSHNRSCTIQIIRVETATKAWTKKQEGLETTVEIDAQSIDTSMDEGPQLPEDNQVLVHSYFPHRAFSTSERRSSSKRTTPDGAIEAGVGVLVHIAPTLQDAIGLSKTILGSRDLLMLGRGRTTKRDGKHSSAASVHSPEHAQTQVTVRSTRSVGGNNTGGLHLGNLPSAFAGFSTSNVTTPTQAIDNPFGESSAVRPRQTLRSQQSSRDLHHSHQTVSSVLGAAAQSFLSSELVSCLMVVQSGAKRPSGIDASRAASRAVSRAPSIVIRSPSQQHQSINHHHVTNNNPVLSAHSRGVSFERGHPAPTFTVSQHVETVEDLD
jgi:hypothetical protein